MLVEKKFNKIGPLLILTLAMSLLSCVGTVADKNIKETKIETSAPGNAYSFEGIDSVNPISHDKVELFFRPADGDPSKLTYEIYINNSPIPIKVLGTSLTLNDSRLYFFTVTGLTIQSSYNFNMRVVEAGSEAKAPLLDSTQSITTKTFSNETADFMGISSIVLGSGKTGQNSVTVKWIPATTVGSSLAQSLDPYTYEITNIQKDAQLRYINDPSVTVGRNVFVTTAIGAAPSALREQVITGLLPDTTYYFQVRAIHKSYAANLILDATYKREMNTRFLKVTTQKSGLDLSFPTALNAPILYINNPVAEIGLRSLDVNWIPAAGDFTNYRLCYLRAAISTADEPTTDSMGTLYDSYTEPPVTPIPGVPYSVLSTNRVSGCFPVPAFSTFIRIGNLFPYAYYQFKVIACGNDLSCGFGTSRIISKYSQKRVVTNIAPFNGIKSIANPSNATNDSTLSQISLNFDAPVVAAGYLNQFKIYCHDPQALGGTRQELIPSTFGAGAASATSVSGCSGIKIITPFPASAVPTNPAYLIFITAPIVVELPLIDSTKTYCFSLVPSIRPSLVFLSSILFNSPSNQVLEGNAIIKCITPQIITPTVAQFPGRLNECKVDSSNKITLNWTTPTSGLFTNFVAFNREITVNDRTSPFSFPDAKSGVAGYSSTCTPSSLPSTAITCKTNTLKPGRTYALGVLSYLTYKGTTIYSQSNTNVWNCTVPLPKPTFKEWIDIFAIGPKEDGLTPTNKKRNIFETLDDDGVPIEIFTDPSTGNPDAPISKTFNGVYGTKDAVEGSDGFQASNSGIIKIAWKDIIFPGGKTMYTYTRSEEADPAATPPRPAFEKSSRTYGYRVYRSEDNKLTWINLTEFSLANRFQSTSNSGLITASDFSWRKRNNDTLATTEKTVFFTDYSVKYAGTNTTNNEIDRARTYWYKIVPVYEGQELVYDNGANTNHHIIRVTLPPRNMALVHRLMANRTICLEMGKPVDTLPDGYYGCEYNGMGTTKLSMKRSGNYDFAYDLGGDLLVDRFELSCPFTRGDVEDGAAQSLPKTGEENKLAFKGNSSDGSKFKGCFNPSSCNNNDVTKCAYEPASITYPHGTLLSYKKVLRGDCFGKDEAIITNRLESTPSGMDPVRVPTQNIIYPGANGDSMINVSQNKLGIDLYNIHSKASSVADMTDPNAITFNEHYFPTQSEFGAVYYMRSNHRHSNSGIPNKLVGPGDTTLTYNSNIGHSSCSINLPYTTTDGSYRPRWIPVNSIFDRLQSSKPGTSPINLYDKKMNDILKNLLLYEDNVALTANSKTLARVASSNSAKLPPLDGLAASDLTKICGTYKVEVGVQKGSSSSAFISFDVTPREKRLMRRKESIVAAAWPAQYSEDKITGYENGSSTDSCNSNITSALGTAEFNSSSNDITTLFPEDSKSTPLVMVGTSKIDSSANTEKCVSRFGIQDLAGNMSETNSDEIFCAYPAAGAEKISFSALGAFPNYAYPEDSLYDPDTFGTATLTAAANSGSCSMVNNGSAKYMRDDLTLLTENVFNYDDTLNSHLVKKGKLFDQGSVLTNRNGDGSFLDFDQIGLAKNMNQSNTMSIEKSYYFNPALGIPTTCAGSNVCTSVDSDNRIAKTFNQISKPSGPLATITNFPINNSIFSNPGLSEIYTQSSSQDSITGDINYLSYEAGAIVTKTLTSGATKTLKFVHYSVERGSPLKIYTGGNASTPGAGRYSMELSGRLNPGRERDSQSQAGGRCAVMIND